MKSVHSRLLGACCGSSCCLASSARVAVSSSTIGVTSTRSVLFCTLPPAAGELDGGRRPADARGAGLAGKNAPLVGGQHRPCPAETGQTDFFTPLMLLILLPQHVRGEAITRRAKIRLRHSCDTSTHNSPSIGTSRNPLPDQTPPYTRTNVVKRAQRPRCADIMREDRAVVWSCVVALVALPLVVSACLGDYEQCSSGACVLYAPDCGKYVAHARGPEARGSLFSPLCIACVARCTDSFEWLRSQVYCRAILVPRPHDVCGRCGQLYDMPWHHGNPP